MLLSLRKAAKKKFFLEALKKFPKKNVASGPGHKKKYLFSAFLTQYIRDICTALQVHLTLHFLDIRQFRVHLYCIGCTFDFTFQAVPKLSVSSVNRLTDTFIRNGRFLDIFDILEYICTALDVHLTLHFRP